MIKEDFRSELMKQFRERIQVIQTENNDYKFGLCVRQDYEKIGDTEYLFVYPMFIMREGLNGFLGEIKFKREHIELFGDERTVSLAITDMLDGVESVLQEIKEGSR